MAKTETGAIIDAWAEVAQNAIREGAAESIATAYESLVTVDVALSSTAAHTGTLVIVETSEQTSGDDTWAVWQTAIGVTGTAVTLGMDAVEPVAETVIACTNPATAKFDHDGKLIFIENVTDVTKSEIARQSANSGDGGDIITILDGLTNEQDADGVLWSQDGDNVSAVSQHEFYLPATKRRVRVLINNKYDADGATVHTRTRISKVATV